MTVLDPERQQKAKEYARISRRVWLVDMALGGTYALAWLLAGWSISLREYITGFTSNQWLVVAVYVAIFGGVYFVINAPLSFYSGYVLPHRFDQANQSLRDWLIEQFKGLLVMVPIGLILLEGMYAVLRAFPETWWIWATGGLLVFSVILGNLAPILIMPIFNKFVPLGDEHAELADRLMTLAVKAKTKVKGVFKFDMSRQTKAANAALTGIGNTRRIILSDTLISEFTPDEIETVLGHELGHQVHRDIAVLMAFGTITTAIGFYLASLAMTWFVSIYGFTSVADVAAFPALLLVMGIYSFLTTPLENSISRWRENLADDYALEITGKNDAFASAFTRLANQNLGEIDPEKWVVWLFYSHPPLGERIAKAVNWKPAGLK